jgi:hypothetical protein
MSPPTKTKLDLLCPKCGRKGAGFATVSDDGKSASVTSGFFLRVSPEGKTQIICLKCRTMAHEVQ